MGSYELDSDREHLHYTGDGWNTIEISRTEADLFEDGKLSGFDLFNDGREVD